MVGYSKPLPKPDKCDMPYWETLKKHELRMQACLECGEIWFPPNPACPRCLSKDYKWAKLSGKGKVWSWVIFHQLYFESFADDIPYNVIVVKLDEGPIITSNMVECRDEDIECNMPVEVVFDDVTENMTLPRFRPTERAKQGE